MDLAEEVAARLALDSETASAGLANLLVAVRMGIDTRTWDQVRQALPGAGNLLAKASTAGGRTAEMVSLTSPGAVRKRLEAAGLSAATVAALADALRDTLREKLPADAAGRALTALDRALG